MEDSLAVGLGEQIPCILSRNENDGQAGLASGESTINLKTIRARQGDIDQEESEGVPVGVELAQSFGTIGGQDGAIAIGFEYLAGHGTQAFVIVDDKDSFGGMGRNRQRCYGFLDAGDGEIDAEDGPVARAAGNVDETAMLIHDAQRGGEAEARAFAFRLGGEKRLEQMFHCGVVDPGAGVGNRDENVVAGASESAAEASFLIQLLVGCGKAENAAVRHGVARVDAEIHEDAIDLRGVGASGLEIGSEIKLEVDAGADHRLQERNGLLDEAIQIDAPRLDRLFSGVGEQMASESGGALQLLANLTEGFGGRATDGNRFGAQLGPAEDRAEDIVEVVSDAAGELAERFEPLELTHAQLEELMLATQTSFVQFPLDGGDQAREVVLHDVVAGADFHGAHCCFLAEGARNEEKRDAETTIFDDPQGFEAAEIRHGMVGENKIPRLRGQSGFQLGGGFDSSGLHVVAAMAELAKDQGRIELGIFDEEQAEGNRHLAASEGVRTLIEREPVEAEPADSVDEFPAGVRFVDVAIGDEAIGLQAALVFDG